MDVSAIADASVSLSLSQIQGDVGTTVLKSALDFQQSSNESMVQMMNTVPSFGHTLDMKV